MKEKWIVANSSRADLYPSPEWRFELWDTEKADAFVAENYSDLLETYLGYEQGVFLFPYRPSAQDPDCWVSPPGLPVGINNAFMAAAPGHPFLKHTTDNIKRFDLNWISLYVTDMFSAGCHYISTMHATYSHHSDPRVLPREYKLGGPSITPIFEHLGAASWYRGDVAATKLIGVFFEWFLDPWKVFFFAGICIPFSYWLSLRRARKAAQVLTEDTELFDLEQSPVPPTDRREDCTTHEELDAEIEALGGGS